MGISVSILLIAVGAILTWGVTAEAQGLDVNAIGVILMVVGIVGLVISVLFWSSWGGVRRRTAYVEGGPNPYSAWARRRATVIEEDDVPPVAPPP
jgi:heme/copper-type cytochrome/quinol oxidase subunit 2